MGLAVHTQNPRDGVLCSDEDFHHVCIWKLRLVEQAAHSAFAVRQLPMAGVLQFLAGHSCPQGPWGWAVGGGGPQASPAGEGGGGRPEELGGFVRLGAAVLAARLRVGGSWHWDGQARQGGQRRRQ